MFLPPKLSVLLKIIFFISLKTTKITSKIQISEGDVCHVTYSFKIMLFISTGIYDDKLRPQILSVVPTANAPLIEVVTKAGLTVWQRNDISCITRNMSLIFIIWHWWENICFPMWQWCNPDVTYFFVVVNDILICDIYIIESDDCHRCFCMIFFICFNYHISGTYISYHGSTATI